MFFSKIKLKKKICKKHEMNKNKIIYKLEDFYENFKDIDNVPISQCTFGGVNFDKYYCKNKFKYFFKINGKSYRLIREIEKHENIKREIFIVNNLDKNFVKLDLMEQTKIDNNGVIVNFLCSDFGNDIENGIKVGGVDANEYNNIIDVINEHFHKHFEEKSLNGG